MANCVNVFIVRSICCFCCSPLLLLFTSFYQCNESFYVVSSICFYSVSVSVSVVFYFVYVLLNIIIYFAFNYISLLISIRFDSTRLDSIRFGSIRFIFNVYPSDLLSIEIRCVSVERIISVNITFFAKSLFSLFIWFGFSLRVLCLLVKYIHVSVCVCVFGLCCCSRCKFLF